MMKLLLIQARQAARGLGSQGAEGRSSQQKRHFTKKLARLEFVLRKLGLLSVNVQDYPQTSFQQHIEQGGCALPKDPFPRLKPNIGDGMRQASAFGLVKTGKNFGVPQFFRSKHGTRFN